MDIGAAECGADEPAVAGAALRFPGPDRARAAAERRKGGKPERREAFLDLALQLLRSLERIHHILGLQRHCRRRHLRGAGERPADVARLRALPSFQKAPRRYSAVPFPGIRVDCVGALVHGEFADFLALAGPRQRLRAQHPQHSVVRIHRNPRRQPLDMGGQPGLLRPNGQHT